MNLDTTTLIAILAMAVVTYLTRIAGLFVADRLVLTGRAKAAFDAIPPAVLVAVIAPTALTTGWAEAIAAAIRPSRRSGSRCSARWPSAWLRSWCCGT
jgi:uncharacterized membrane protein